MTTYIIEIPPADALPEIENDVAGEEAGASKFISSSLSFHGGKITNLATFEILAPGTQPKALHFVKAGSPVPPNTAAEWAGVMIVSGTNTAVATYREK